MDEVELKSILEGMLFVSESPIKLKTLTDILPEASKESIEQTLESMKAECEDPARGLELVEVAGGIQYRTKPRLAEHINRLKKAKPVKFSPSAMETLAIVAYRQPVIRPEIERIRGVDCGWTLRVLMEKGLIKMMGRKDLPGRPIIYGTTQTFLELFGLNSLVDLPTLKEIQPPPAVEELESVEKEIRGEEEIRSPTEVIREGGGESQEAVEGTVQVNEASSPQGGASVAEDHSRPEDEVE